MAPRPRNTAEKENGRAAKKPKLDTSEDVDAPVSAPSPSTSTVSDEPSDVLHTNDPLFSPTSTDSSLTPPPSALPEHEKESTTANEAGKEAQMAEASGSKGAPGGDNPSGTGSSTASIDDPANADQDAKLAVKQQLLNTFAALPVLQPTLQITGLQSSAGVPHAFPVRTVRIEDTFPSYPNVMARVADVCCNAGSKIIRNIALLNDPSVLDNRQYLFLDGYPAKFFTVGVVQSSSVTKGDFNRQLTITPFTPLWVRGANIMSAAMNAPFAFINSFKGGVSFVTAWKKATESNAPHDGSVSPQAPRLPWNYNIPVFNGTAKFEIASYRKLPKVIGELEKGSTVVVIFSAQRYDFPPDRRQKFGLNDNFQYALAFNAIAVILLAAPDPAVSTSPLPLDNDDVYGVIATDELVARLNVPQEIVDDDREDE